MFYPLIKVLTFIYRNSAYSIFSQDKMAELRKSFHGVELLVEVGRQWGNLSGGEKQKYIERVKEVV